MNSLKSILSDDTLTELFTFNGHSEATEWYAYIHVTDCMKTADEQIASVAKAIENLKDTELDSSHCLMARCHVSDAATQHDAVRNALSEMLGCLSIVQQPPLDGTKIAVWIYAVANVESYRDDYGNVCMNHNGYRHMWTTAYGEANGDTHLQTVDLFNDYCGTLAGKGMSLADNCKRTWLFVNDIDNNYADAVTGRNEIFDRENLTDQTHYIASTGISGYTGRKGTHMIFDTYAVDGMQNGQTQYLYALSHLNRTSEYGVRFERGVALHYGDRTHAFISGTASIDDKGCVVYANDIKKQTVRMWENVEALLKEADMNLEENAAMMTIYLRDIADYHVVKEMFDSRFPQHPKAIVLAPVCRPGWLIEMECICIKDADNNYPDF